MGLESLEKTRGDSVPGSARTGRDEESVGQEEGRVGCEGVEIIFIDFGDESF